jgi:hypothetical protein
VLPAAGVTVPAYQVLHRHVAANQTRLDDLPERVELELVVGHQHHLRLVLVEFDRGLGALEVVPLGYLFARLVQGVVDLLEIDVRGDVKGALAGHL